MLKLEQFQNFFRWIDIVLVFVDYRKCKFYIFHTYEDNG